MKPLLLLALLAINLSKPGAALYPFKLIHNASHAISLTPEQWASEFQCSAELLFINETSKNAPPIDCNRDKNAWIYKHIDELQGEFRFLVHQESIDARFADSVYLANGHTGLNFHHYKFNSGDSKQDELNMQLAAGPEFNSDACKRHLKQMLDLVEELGTKVNQMRLLNDTSTRLAEQHFRLARVLDSFGRYESGQIGGRYHSFGLYDQCIGTPLLLGDGNGYKELVGSRYCWARLNLDRHLSGPLKDASHGDPRSSIVSYFPGDFKFHMAICLPRSCHSASFAHDANQHNFKFVQRLVDSQFKMPKSMYLDESLPLESVFCLVDEHSKIAQIPLDGKLFVVFVLVWVSACIFSTYRRRTKHNLMLDDSRMQSNSTQAKEKRSFWSHLDLFESWYEFLGEGELSRSGDRVNLDPLNFVKWFCTLLVVMAHATVLSGPLTVAHVRLAAIMETSHIESLSLFGFVLVDSFFVITGMLMTYIYMKRTTAFERRETAKLEQTLPPTITTNQKTKIRPNILDFEREFSPLGKSFYKACALLTLTRYLRLVPLFFMVFWFKKSVYPYLGSGPMWDYGLNRDTTIGGCQQESWLTPFTFLSAYLPAAQQCLPQTWTISNDLFFSMVMPPIIVLLYKWPRSAFSLSALSLFVSLHLGKLIYHQLDARARFEIEQLRDHSVVILFQLASYIYTIPLYRMPAIIVGTLTGYVLFKYNQCASANKSEVGVNDDGMDSRSDHRWPWWFRGPLTYLCLAIVMSAFFLSLLSPEFRRFSDEETKRSMVNFMLLYYHLIWSLANSVLFLRLVTDFNNHFIMRMFSSRFFSTAGKLSYTILLIHWDLLMFDLHIETQALEFSRWNYFGSMSLAYFASIPAAIIIFVVFENPMDKLTKTYLLHALTR